MHEGVNRVCKSTDPFHFLAKSDTIFVQIRIRGHSINLLLLLIFYKGDRPNTTPVGRKMYLRPMVIWLPIVIVRTPRYMRILVGENFLSAREIRLVTSHWANGLNSN